jgi:hypothetical protein
LPKIAALIAGLLALSLSYGHVLSKEQANTNPPLTTTGTYFNVDKMDCGGTRLTITTQCIDNNGDNTNPYCHSQTVSFSHNKNHQTVTHYYSHKASLNQPFIYSVACLKKSNTHYFDLTSSNLGNCKTCEWHDFFSEFGTYIGSSTWVGSTTSFKRKSITPRNEQILLSATHTMEITLTTIKH